MKTRTMIIFLGVFYATLLGIAFFGTFGIEDVSFKKDDLVFIIGLASLAFGALIFEIVAVSVFIMTSGSLRAFLMVTISLIVTSTTFTIVWCSVFVVVANYLNWLNDTNQSEIAMLCVIVSALITLVIYALVFKHVIQKNTIAFYLKMTNILLNTKKTEEEILNIPKEEEDAKKSVIQFYNTFGTLIGIGYGWFFVGKKSNILDVLNSTLSMYTIVFSIGILIYVMLSYIPFGKNTY